jgi:hypothetical protein
LALLQVHTAALVLGQRNHTTQVRFSQTLQLLLQTHLAAAQVFTSGLQLLREPMACMSTLQRLGDALGMTQQIAQVIPDQGIKLAGRNEPGRAVLSCALAHLPPLASADIVGVVGLDLPRHTREAALPAADQGA